MEGRGSDLDPNDDNKAGQFVLEHQRDTGHFTVTVAGANIATPLSATPLKVKNATVQASIGNGVTNRLGGAGVLMTDGLELIQGSSIPLNNVDLNKVFFISTNAADKMNILFTR